jgi:hypothetical protein
LRFTLTRAQLTPTLNSEAGSMSNDPSTKASEPSPQQADRRSGLRWPTVSALFFFLSLGLTILLKFFSEVSAGAGKPSLAWFIATLISGLVAVASSCWLYATKPSSVAIKSAVQQVGQQSSDKWLKFAVVMLIFLSSILSIDILFSVKASGHEIPQGVSIAVLAAGAIGILGAIYWLYDALFTMAEARWPAAKRVRRVLCGLFWLMYFLQP